MSDPVAKQFSFPVQGYQHFHACRKKLKDHGGVSVFLKNNIKVAQLKCVTNPEILLLSLGDCDLLLIACYASPGRAQNRVQNVFEEISDITSLVPTHKHWLVCGDFNARIGTLNRCTAAFDAADPHDIHRTVDVGQPCHPRVSQDTVICTRGRHCLRFCEVHNLDILNGCCHGDEHGCFTYGNGEGQGNSVIDLFMVSATLFDNVTSLTVSDYHGLSDHRRLTCHLSLPYDVTLERVEAASYRPPSWVQKEWQLFPEMVRRHFDSVQRITRDIHSTDKEGLNRIARKLNKQLALCARRAFRGFSSASRIGVGTMHFEWWDTRCEELQQKMFLERKRCKEAGINWSIGLRQATCAFKNYIKIRRRRIEVLSDIAFAKAAKKDPWRFWKRLKGGKEKCTLTDVEGAVTYFQGILGFRESGIASDAQDVPLPCQVQTLNEDIVESLNQPITTSEVISALKTLKNSRSTADGHISELFKYAKVWDPDDKCWSYLLVQDLVDMFNRCFSDGLGIPDVWRKAVLVPLYKGHGDTASLDKYRGISILTALYKLYSTVICRRLDSACEHSQVRAPTQCGFRSRMGTTAALFTLQHVVHSTCSTISKGGLGRYLYVCFIDFEKAFHLGTRECILNRLQEIGVHGKLLDAIKDLYHDTKLQIKINSNTSRGFVVTFCGVRQGCPLSPLLFGLFIEQIHFELQSRARGQGTVVNDEDLGDLTYADDIALLSVSERGLQVLCNILGIKSLELGMKVNSLKSEVVVFRPARAQEARANITVCGNPIEVKDGFKYLGLCVHESTWFSKAADMTCLAAEKAMWALLSKFEGLKIKCIKVKLMLFGSLVGSVGDYGCQVWGVDFLRFESEAHIFNNPLQKLTLRFLRLISGAHTTVHRWRLLKEFGIRPCQVRWACLCARWWQQCTSLEAPALTKNTMIASINLFCQGNDKCWVSKFLTCMSRLGLIAGLSLSTLRDVHVHTIMRLRFEESRIITAFDEQYERLWPKVDIDPRGAASRGLTLAKYYKWFDSGSTHLEFSAPESYIRCLFKFRLGSLPLKCYDRTLGDRMQRHCTLCHQNMVEDEYHVVFECDVYDSLRRQARWRELFDEAQGDLKKLMGFQSVYKVSHFLHCIFAIRKKLLEEADLVMVSHTRNEVLSFVRHATVDLFEDD